MPAHGPARAAFTLIELLVVVAIMALLLSILLPSLARAKSQAREVACATSLRTWGQGFHLYANDYGGILPHADDRSRHKDPNLPDPEHPEHESCYIDVVPPLLHIRAWRDFSKGSKPTNGIWQCLDAKPLADSVHGSNYKPSLEGYHSYAMNSYLEYDFEFGRPDDVPPFPSFLKLDLCQASGKTLLMFEQTLDPTQGSGQTGGHREAGRFPAEDARALSERHAHGRSGLGANVIMIDGHLEWRSDLWDETLGSPRIPRRGDLTWYPYWHWKLTDD
ncbi:MAG: prepilin-type N-terminal cleavage/methylation domain-containing protein [Phycisphaerae bacterium]|nr:prepilin-type N-terminal cleavage/methylation domain-containing protein [Phycisphaerae bacterium]